MGVVLGLFYLTILLRLPREMTPPRLAALGAFSVVLFLLYMKGWSPQFIIYLIPLLLIAFPTGEAAVWSLLLTITTFLEIPAWAIWVHPLAALPNQANLAVLELVLLQTIVFGRTILLLLILARLYPRIARERG